MSYRDAVAKRIEGDRDALDRRGRLWEEIASGYEKEGQDGVKSVLVKRSSGITQKFNRLLRDLEGKLWDRGND